VLEVILPTPRQLAFQERQFGAFVHFGMATWYDGPASAVFPRALREPYAFNLGHWGSMIAQPPASVFNPVELNAAQWVAAARAMGARHIVLTAKHHNGFCLWPTATTPYSVCASPWRGGRGDVLAEFAEAARAAGLGVGLYVSAGDVSQGCFSTPEPQGKRRLIGDLDRYVPIFEKQLREVLGGYGPLCEIWLDGALDPFGPDVLRPDGSPVGRGTWDRLAAVIRALQPGAVIMGGTQPDVRWPGNEEGLAPYPLWNVVEPGQEAAHWVPPGATGWIVPEADVFTRPSWFWTPGSDGALFSLERLRDVWDRSVGHGANLLINMTPDRRGLVPEAEVRRLAELGDDVRRRFGHPIAETAGEGRWSEGQVLELAWERTATVASAVMEEDLRFGQRVSRHRVEAEVGGAWRTVAEGTTIGRRRIVSFAPVAARRLRLRILETASLPEIRLFAAYG
jgi:alpha-L-fucosidase